MVGDTALTDSSERPHDGNPLNGVELALSSRKTSKVLLPVELRGEQQALWKVEHTQALRHMLEAASWAPFHKRAHEQHLNDDLAAPMPWRFHVLDPDACTRLLTFLESQNAAHPDSKWTRAWQSKIKEMVSACGVLIQVTWLPDPASSSSSAEGVVSEGSDSPNSASITGTEFNQKNIEHVAAASSAVQSLLVAAQSRQWLSYWSSGGILRDEDVFDYLGINRCEQLLGSVFLSPEAHASARIIDGGLRDQRGDLSGWVHWVQG